MHPVTNELNGSTGSVGEELYNVMPRCALSGNQHSKIEIMIGSKAGAFPLFGDFSECYLARGHTSSTSHGIVFSPFFFFS